MANELNYYGDLDETGLTVIARVYDSSGAQIGSDISCSEVGTLAIYTGDMPSATLGQYGIRFFDGTTLIGQGCINWDGTKECELNLDVEISTRATPLDITTSETNIIAEIDANETKIDTLTTNVSAIPTTDSVADLTPVLTAVSNLNDFDPANDTVARVTLVDTTTANTDMRGTDGANTIVPPTTAEIEAALLNEGDGQQLIDAIVQAIGNSNVDEIALVAAIRADLERAGGTLDLLPTLSEIEASTVLAKTSDIAGLNDITAAEVWSEVTRTITGGQIDTIAGTIQTLDALDVAQDLKHDATQGLINALNNVSAADIKVQADQALVDYDGPTKAELNAAQAAIEAAIASNALTAQEIWDYLQSETTVTDSMKDAVQIVLKNSKLIPATL